MRKNEPIKSLLRSRGIECDNLSHYVATLQGDMVDRIRHISSLIQENNALERALFPETSKPKENDVASTKL